MLNLPLVFLRLGLTATISRTSVALVPPPLSFRTHPHHHHHQATTLIDPTGPSFFLGSRPHCL